MATKNLRKPSILLFLYTLVLSTQISAQNTPTYACDTVKNPRLAEFKFCDTQVELWERVEDLMWNLSLEEKIGFLTNSGKGLERLGIPSYEWWNEALHGVGGNGSWGTRFNDLIPAATSFPQVLLTAASFNVTLFEAIGKVVSTEARAMYNYGLAGLTLFAPNVNIFRDPRWGRGQETPGEDPLLTSSYATAYIRGLQQREDGDKEKLKTAACCKHYNAYDLDHWKNIIRTNFNAQVTKQDLEDTFKPPFKSCVVDGKVACVMCSYNQVNGKPSCADPDLDKVVRGEWNLQGYIVSDYDAIAKLYNSQHYTKTPDEAAALALLAGVDLDLGNFLVNYTERAVKSGLVDDGSVSVAIKNTFASLMRLGFFDGDPRKQLYGQLGPKDVCSREHQELAHEAARQGIVLLKNLNNTLPLSLAPIKTLAILGPYTEATGVMLGNYAGYACSYITPYNGISDVAVEAGVVVESGTYAIDLAKEIAATTDATILIMGDDISSEQEDHDRISLRLPGEQEAFITAVANVSKGSTILVLMSGGGLDIQFAKDDPNIASILWAGYPGESGGAAMADVIYGFHNPSGKLPITWYPESYTDKIPMTNMNMRPDPQTGYPGRTYRFHKGPTVYDFGYGLSYTKFTYALIDAAKFITIPSGKYLSCQSTKCVSVDIAEGYCPHFDLVVRVANEGEMAGTETVLLFSLPPGVHGAPQKQLLGFNKVFLEPGKEGYLVFKLDLCRDFSVIDKLGKRRVALGDHMLIVGNLAFSVKIATGGMN